MENPLPPIEWEVQDWITRGSRVMLYGEFGAGKSYLAHSLAIALAMGKPWLEKYATQRRKVLFLDEEMAEVETRRRLKRLGLGMGLDKDPEGMANLVVASHSFDGAGLDISRRMMLLSHLKELPAEVIFIDSMRRVMLGNEDKAQDVAAFWRMLEPVWNRGERTVIVLHHMNKPPQEGMREERHRASGSTDILAGVDEAIAVGKMDQAGIMCQATVTQTKARSAGEHERIYVEWPIVTGDLPQRISLAGKGDGRNPGVWGSTGTVKCSAS